MGGVCETQAVQGPHDPAALRLGMDPEYFYRVFLHLMFTPLNIIKIMATIPHVVQYILVT